MPRSSTTALLARPTTSSCRSPTAWRPSATPPLPDEDVPAADAYDGGEGRDTVSYQGRRRGVVASLGPAGGGGEPGELDRYTAVEDLNGGLGDDRLTGDDGPNRLYGDVGRDRI